MARTGGSKRRLPSATLLECRMVRIAIKNEVAKYIPAYNNTFFRKWRTSSYSTYYQSNDEFIDAFTASTGNRSPSTCPVPSKDQGRQTTHGDDVYIWSGTSVFRLGRGNKHIRPEFLINCHSASGFMIVLVLQGTHGPEHILTYTESITSSITTMTVTGTGILASICSFLRTFSKVLNTLVIPYLGQGRRSEKRRVTKGFLPSHQACLSILSSNCKRLDIWST